MIFLSTSQKLLICCDGKRWIFLLHKNEWIHKWICNNYKRDPIMLEAYKNTKDKENMKN